MGLARLLCPSFHGSTIINQWVHFEVKLRPAYPSKKPTNYKEDVGTDSPHATSLGVHSLPLAHKPRPATWPHRCRGAGR